MLETISFVTGNISKSWINKQIVVDLYNRITHSNEGNTAFLKTWMNLINIMLIYEKLVKSWLIGKDSDAGRDWAQEEKGTTEDEMAGWHHWLNGRESGWIPGVADGQGGLACCDSWGRKESDTTKRLNWTDQGYTCP